MAKTWLSIRVDLVDGAHAAEVWPRPGRVLLARPGMTFRMLADSINIAFARWDRGHLHAFTMADGTRIAYRGPWDDLEEDDLDDTEVTLTRLALGEQFAFAFDFGDGWMHLCTVAEEMVDPREVYGEVPDRPVPYFGWGWIPDQYGRRWDTDDGGSSPPPPPEPPLGDLPDLHYTWGSRAVSVAAGGDHADGSPGAPWDGESVTDLRKALATRDVPAAVDLLVGRDAAAVAHLAGPLLLDAAAAGPAGAGLVVERLVGVLSERGWLGDDELVDEFDRVTQDLEDVLQPVPVRLEELAHMLDGPTDFDEGWMLELATGRFWSRDPEAMTGEQRPEDFDDPDAFLAVSAVGPGPGYGDMRDFIDTVTDDALATRLSDAIQGKGAFRRFRAVLFDDEHWWERWSTWSHERQLARARWWLADAGYRPATGADGDNHGG